MEIAVPRYFVDSEEDSSTGSPSPSSRSSVSGSDQRLSLDDALPEWQCKYTGKICPHPRAQKKNGKLHRLCEEHRKRANVNQRNLQQKRREARARAMMSPYTTSTGITPFADEDLDWFVPLPPVDAMALQSVEPEPLTTPSELTAEDYEALELLFTTSISTDSTDDDIYDVMSSILPSHSI